MNLKYHKSLPPAVFFDRDGTLIKDMGYLSQPEGVELLPTVGDVLGELRHVHVLCIVVTNQSGVGRGMMSMLDVTCVNHQLDKVLWESSRAVIHKYFVCPHRPEERCVCRKPSPYFFYLSRTLFGLNLSQCWMIGNKHSDCEAGRSAGMKTYRTAPGKVLGDWWKLVENSRV